MDWFNERIQFDADEGGGDAGTDAGDAPAAWHEGHEFSDEQIGYIQNKGWDSPDKMLNSYQELEKFKGADETQLLKIPGTEDAEAWKALYGRLGRPDEASGYDLKYADGENGDAKLLEAYAAAAHEADLNQKQTSVIFDKINEYSKEMAEQTMRDVTLQSETEIAELRKEWGEKGYNERKELASRAYRQFGFDPESSTMLEQIVGSASLIRLMANIGEKMQGDASPNPESHDTGTFGTTLEQVKANKQALMAELVGDRKRLITYNQAKGPDYEQMERYDERLAQDAELIRR